MIRVFLFSAMLLAFVSVRAAEPGVAELPTETEFLQDDAELLQPADREAVKAVCAKSYQEKELPIAVYTMTALGSGLDIEKYARTLLDERARREPNRHWDKGCVLIVSKADHKMRIQVGTFYGHQLDGSCDIVRDQNILPAFKAGNFSEGMRSGTVALADLLREESVPHPTRDLIIGVIVLLFGVFFVMAPFILFALLVIWLARRAKRSSGSRSYSTTDRYNSNTSSYSDSSSSSSSSSSDSGSSSSSSSDSGGGSTGSW